MWWFCCLRLQEMEHQLSIKPVRETSNWYGLENGVPNKQLVICIQFSVAPTMPPMPPHPGMAVSGIIAETMALSFMPIRCLFFRGRRQGRQPLNPAMPRRVVWEAKHSFSYPGARPCRWPSPKILQPAGVFTFLGVRGGKKEGKIWRCVLEVLVGRFLVDF